MPCRGKEHPAKRRRRRCGVMRAGAFLPWAARPSSLTKR
ncbi:hypothetical protein EKH55_0255 [Sinorhizobium alkalisoli]|nr:hypothetical protein EKH55_0255 [Sinorhizobium alkalisoli]